MSIPIFVEFRGGLTDFAAKMGVANAEIDKLGTKGAAVSSKLATAGKYAGLAIVGTAVAVGVESAKMSGNFQQATNVLVTAAGESTKNIGMIRSGIMAIAELTGTPWQNVTDGMYILEKAGYRGAAALTVEKAAAEGAREENANLGTVTQAVTSIMASYHLPVSSAVMVMDQLKTAAGESKTTMEEFAGSLSTVLPVASANKISFADVAGSLASLTQHGTSANEASQELANTIRGLSAPNSVAVKEMAQLGISAQDVSLHMGDGPGGRGLAGTLNYLSQTVLKQMGPAGTVLLKTFNQSKAAAADANTMIEKMPAGIAALAKQYAAGSLSLLAWRNGLKALPADQAALGAQWATVENQAAGFNSAIRAGLPGTQTYTAAIKKLTGGANGLNATLQLTGPSLDATKARIAAVRDTVVNADGSVNGWASTAKLFNVEMGSMAQQLSDVAIQIGGALIPYILKATEAGRNAVEWLIKHKTAAVALASAIGGILATAIAVYVVQTVAGLAKSIASFIADIAKGVWWVATKTAQFVSAAALYTWYYGGLLAQAVASGATWLAGEIARGVAWLTAWASMYAAAAVAAVASATATAAAWVVANIAMIAATGGIVLAIGALVVAGIYVYNHWSTIWRDIKQVTKDAWDGIVSVATTAWNWLHQGVIGAGLDALLAFWKLEWTLVRDTIKLVWDAAVTIVKTGWSVLKDEFRLGCDLLTGKWGKLWGDVKKLVSDAWTGIKALLGGFLSDAGTLLYDVGAQIIKGLINGMKSAFKEVKATLGGLVSSVTSDVKSGFGIFSPSRVMADLGQYIPMGFAQGIDGGSGSVSAAIGRMTGLAGSGGVGSSVGGSYAGSVPAVNIIFNGPFVGGSKSDMTTLGNALAVPIRNALLSHKKTNGITKLGLA